MRQSELFTKTRKEAPADEVSKNASLLIRAGFIDKLQSGVYTYLPLGFRVLKKIESIILKEMETVGGQEVLMPSLHPKENWTTTGRWDSMDDLYKVTDSSGRENALGGTHEEIVVPLAKQFLSSYKQLPLALFQIQNKFRMELRAKSGILRGREFFMKDLYSFHADEEDLEKYYAQMKISYQNIFQQMGIGSKTYLTFASGGSFSKYSHEFQTVTEAGEDIIFICDACRIAVNKEITETEGEQCPECGNTNLKKEKSIEVGNIFQLKTKFSEPFNLTYKNESGEDIPVSMGCYGIGLGRLMGVVVEALSDEKGIIWPESIAPFKVHLIALGDENSKAHREAFQMQEKLEEKGTEVLFDDRDLRAGEKFADADLLGIPLRVVVSESTLKEGKIEVKRRAEERTSLISFEELVKNV